MAPPGSYDDGRHKKEEAERRDRRKAAKSQKSDAQREKERKRKEHAQRVLQKHGGERKKQKTAKDADKSKFQELLAQRAQGFQIDFKFRNAPPRPPVGPCFVGSGIDGELLELAQYKPLNAVEVNHRWKLHNEPDLGVPLAPSAMDPTSYSASMGKPGLHPDDDNLLDWKGSLGDTAAEELKKRRDNARAAARLALMGKSPAKLLEKAKSPLANANTSSTKKAFSRVLDETMQSWMKKTTYLSNDYTRKVHDFKSLAKTKQELVQDLAVREKHFSQRRSGSAISRTFDEAKAPITKHPSKPKLTPVMSMPFLPNVEHWGNAYTHVVMDKSPGEEGGLDKAFVANVQKKDANARMTCQLFVPKDEDDAMQEDDSKNYQAIQQYELDVLPLKEEDAPHVTFCIWVDPTTQQATYLPIPSRVNLSIGRPLKKKNYNMKISKRPMTAEDEDEINERVAEVDFDMEMKVSGTTSARPSSTAMQADGSDDDGLDDDDDDSDQGDSFLNTTKTIVAS